MYFELKVFDLRGKKPSNTKTKIQLNARTPFSADTQPEIGKAEFTPQRVRKLLHFIADDLIIRLVIKANESKFKDLFEQQNEIRKGRKFTANYSSKEKEALREIEAKMIKRGKELLEKYPDQTLPDLTQFNFDELSPGELVMDVETIVNSNVPPPKRP